MAAVHDAAPEEERPLVVLLRGSREPDPYRDALQQRGFRVQAVPVLRFEPVNTPALVSALGRPDTYGGLLLSSPRAAARVGEVLPPYMSVWAGKPTFCVGPETESIARVHGLNPAPVDGGDGKKLAVSIIDHYTDSRRLFFPCSTRRRDELPDHLAAAGVPVEELPVYDTIPEASPLLAEMERPQWVVFFSPSGIEAVAELLNQGWANVRRAAIGATTGVALAEVGLPPTAVAERPTPEMLADAIAAASRS